MSEQKPKKDLRARLGRTIAPNTPGAPPIAAPGGVIAPPPSAAAPVAAPPAASADAHAPAPAAAKPAAQPAISGPASPGTPVAIAAPPAMASRNAFGGADIAPPPFAKPAEAPRPASAPKSAGPFAAAAPAARQEIRILADDKPVDDADVGRRQGGRVFLVIGVSLLAGAAVGFGGGGTYERNVLYNTVVRDGQAVYTAVDQTSRVVLEAQSQLEALATAAGGGASGHPSVDYTALTALNGLANPMQASHFSDRTYHLFQAGAVDDLFTYYNNIQLLWDQFHELERIAAGQPLSVSDVAQTAVCPVALPPGPDAARAAMTAAADATAAAASAQYVGALSTGPDGTVRVALRFADPELDPATQQPTGRILMRATPTDTATPVELWTPETPITATPTHAIVINGGNSAGVLSERLGAFRAYVAVLQETRTLMTSTIEVQGRLTTSLGDIARLEQTF